MDNTIDILSLLEDVYSNLSSDDSVSEIVFADPIIKSMGFSKANSAGSAFEYKRASILTGDRYDFACLLGLSIDPSASFTGGRTVDLATILLEPISLYSKSLVEVIREMVQEKHNAFNLSLICGKVDGSADHYHSEKAYGHITYSGNPLSKILEKDFKKIFSVYSKTEGGYTTYLPNAGNHLSHAIKSAIKNFGSRGLETRKPLNGKGF